MTDATDDEAKPLYLICAQHHVYWFEPDAQCGLCVDFPVDPLEELGEHVAEGDLRGLLDKALADMVANMKKLGRRP